MLTLGQYNLIRARLTVIDAAWSSAASRRPESVALRLALFEEMVRLGRELASGPMLRPCSAARAKAVCANTALASRAP
jgi:hypothetical protein